MQQELMDLGVWLAEHPETAHKYLEPIRNARVLAPGDRTRNVRFEQAAC
jgi:hypothetical protein